MIVPQIVEPWCHNFAGRNQDAEASKVSSEIGKCSRLKQSRRELQNQQKVGTNKKQQASSNTKTTNTMKGRLSGTSKDGLTNPLGSSYFTDHGKNNTPSKTMKQEQSRKN